MKLLLFLLQCSKKIRYSRSVIALVALTGILSGAANTALLVLINLRLTTSPSSTSALAWGFITLCFVLPISRFASEVLLIHLSARSIFDLRMQLCRRILAAPLRFLEQLGAHRLLATLTEDVPAIANAIVNIPPLCINSAIVVSCLIYLGYLSAAVLVGALAFMTLGILTYKLPQAKALSYLKRAREDWDTLFSHFRALTDGTKELKLHRQRREAFLSHALKSSAASLRDHNALGGTLYAAASNWGHVLFFVFIGLLLFTVPNFEDINAKILTGYTLIILYLMSPLETILNTLPILGRANIAVEKVEELGLSLAAHSTERHSNVQMDSDLSLECLEMVGVTHSYHSEQQNSSFMLGPIDLTFHPGELIFLTGGNGSGKTTLAKLLTGLYVPETGEIRLNGERITDETREKYRQHFSVVFADFYLFESLLGLDGPELDTRAREHLVQLQLEHKVRISGGRVSTTSLSQGQRKRLALLTAYLENRPIYIFDEWAADQDPLFKEIFYLQLLPELKARGKTVLVISHDDRYYDVADRILKLDYGRIEYDKRINIKFLDHMHQTES